MIANRYQTWLIDFNNNIIVLYKKNVLLLYKKWIKWYEIQLNIRIIHFTPFVCVLYTKWVTKKNGNAGDLQYEP